MGKSKRRRPRRDLENEITRAKEETEHWKLTSLVLRHHNSELKNKYMNTQASSSVKVEEGLMKKEIPEEDDDPKIIVYKRKRKRYTDITDQRDNCQCAQLNWEIDVLKYDKVRANAEIERLKTKCLEFDVLKYDKERANAEIESFKSKCLELEVERDLNKMRCNQLKAKIAIVEQTEQERITGLEKENSYQKDICVQLNKDIEDLKLEKKEQDVEIEDYKIKCRDLSAELEQKKMELKNLRAKNEGLDREREDYSTKCIRMEEQIRGLLEERETSVPERICHLEEVVKKMETNTREMFVQLNTKNKDLEYGNRRAEDEKIDSLTKRLAELEALLLGVKEENSTLRGLQNKETCREMDGRVCVANVAHLNGTETTLHSTFTPSCKPSSLQVNFDAVHVSESPHVNNQSETAENTKDCFVGADEHPLGFETEGSSGNLVLLKQDGARATTTCIVEIDSEDEIIEISDSEGE